MLKECMDVFAHRLKETKGQLILDTYVPADGTYLIVKKDGTIQCNEEIIKDKKTKEVNRNAPCFKDICFYDYHSQLVSMNKPIDIKKVIHSNNYLAFFVKKESIVTGKLTDEIIDGYYDVLKNPVEKKYKKSKEASKIYELFEQKNGEVNQSRLEEARAWVKNHIYQLRAMENIDMSRKDYLKIFFEAEQDEYEREGCRYFLPNIYNSNDYNTEIHGTVYGMPDNNLGMNAKKPFLSIKSRKYPAPYLLDADEVMLQKQFFDYLMNLVSAGKYHIYIDTEEKKVEGYRNGEAPRNVGSGYYLRIRKGKTEAEIYQQDNLPGYSQELQTSFDFKNILKRDHGENKHPEYMGKYQRYTTRLEVGQLIDEVFFSKYLANNYLTDAGDISVTDEVLKRNILVSKDAVFNWIFKGIDQNIDQILQVVSLDLIKGTLVNGYRERALWQFNLRWSLQEYFSKKGEKNMAEVISKMKKLAEQKVLSDTTIPVETDEEYYYLVGQLAGYLISLSKAKDKNHSLLNPLMNAKKDTEIKKRLFQLYKKYNYCIPTGYRRVGNLLAMVEGYKPEASGQVNQEMIMLGFACDNIIYKKEEK